jgi:hypothetical protein
MQSLSYDFQDVVGFESKKGTYKIKFSAKEGNIYVVLNTLGYRRAKIGGKYIFYQRVDNKISITNLADIRNAFIDYLRHCREETLPRNIVKEQVIESFYHEFLLKENGLLKHYLADDPSEREIHYLRLQTDGKYMIEFQKRNTC